MDHKAVDPDFEDEFFAAKANGFSTHFFSFEQLTKDNDALYAARRIKQSETMQTIVYRGWMLKPRQYTILYEVLLTKNYQLINSPVEYQNCHYLPDSYRFIKSRTPKTVWIEVENGILDYNRIFESISIFGNSPLIIKDFVKSQKHYWDTACFIPSATDLDKVKSVIGRFVKLQNTDLNEGIVIREFVELNDLTNHSKSGMPLKQEYRLFFLNGYLIGRFDYWEEGNYSEDEQPSIDLFMSLAKTIQSNFFSMDVAKTKKGEWIIIELGDGQVAGLPDKAERDGFYKRVKELLRS